MIGPDSGDSPRDNLAREHVLVAPPDLANLLATSTVYVGAAGTTAVQAACVGTPAVITAAVRNQEAQAAALARAGCAVVADTAHMARACLTLLDDPDERAAMAARGRALVDGRGAGRVADGNPPPGRGASRLMTTVAVIQARCGSTRFPRKVLAPLQGRPMLAHIIDRVSRATLVDRVVVATTDLARDDEVASLVALVRRGTHSRPRGRRVDPLRQGSTRARRRRCRAYHGRLSTHRSRRGRIR